MLVVHVCPSCLHEHNQNGHESAEVIVYGDQGGDFSQAAYNSMSRRKSISVRRKSKH